MDPSGRLNDYEKAITAIGRILNSYDTDQRYPVWVRNTLPDPVSYTEIHRCVSFTIIHFSSLISFLIRDLEQNITGVCISVFSAEVPLNMQVLLVLLQLTGRLFNPA